MYFDSDFFYSQFDFQGANLQGKAFQRERLENVHFQGANLKGANFQGANLRGAKFQGADLKDANLQSAILQGAQFQGADLKDANLQSADIHEANFKGAKLHGANLKQCKDIQIVNWTNAEYDRKTQFPIDFNPIEHGLLRTSRKRQSAIKQSGEQSLYETDPNIKRAIIEIGKYLQKRQGQRKFREDLLKVYRGCCAITGCKVEGVLEAAHVKPYYRDGENTPENGILLRADLHTLFDLNLIVIHPQTKKIEIKEPLQSSGYKTFDGIILRAYQRNIFSPGNDYLEWRYLNYEEHAKQFLKVYLQ